MKRVLLILILFFGGIPCHAQNPPLLWGNAVGGAYADFATAIGRDQSNNVYTTGSFQHIVDFDPGPGVFNLISPGWATYILKQNSTGGLIWAIQFEGNTFSSMSRAETIALDNNGNIIVAGFFSGRVDFDPGPGIMYIESITTADLFIAKINPLGQLIWVKQIPGWPYPQRYKVTATTDPGGHIYLTGTFTGTADFDPGPSVNQLHSTGWDIYVLKLTTAGDFAWVKQISDTGDGDGNTIKLDIQGNIVVGGYFDGIADFDPGAGTFIMNTSNGSSSAFILKLSNNGDFVFAKQFGDGGFRITVNSLCINQNNDIIISGKYNLTTDFDPGPNSQLLTEVGGSDIYILSLSESGTFQWVKSVGGTNIDNINDSFIDNSGFIYLIGNFYGTCDFDPSSRVFNLISSGLSDMFLAIYYPDGSFISAIRIGSTGNDSGNSITVLPSGAIYLCGDFTYVVDIDPCEGLKNIGNGIPETDGFITVLNQPTSSGITINAQTTSLNQGQNTIISTVLTNGGATPSLQWQDSTSAHDWQNITGQTGVSITYSPGQSGDRVRCLMSSNASCNLNYTFNSNTIVFTVNTVTAINPDPAGVYGIRYYPNPAGAEITIDSLRITDRWETAEIINMSGVRYGTITIANKTRVTLTIKRLVPGQYIIALRRKNAVAYLKFIKQ